LTLKQRNKGDRIYQADVTDCAACPLKSQCTGAQCRYVSRHAHEEAFERMLAHPQMRANRRSIVEHPFGNRHFLLRQLEGAKAEMALAVNAYNLKRAISVLGARQLMALMG
jgi:transposase